MKRTPSPVINVEIDRPIVDFRDLESGRDAIFTGTGRASITTKRKAGERIQPLNLRWQMRGVFSAVGEVLELRSLTAESPSGPLTDGVLGVGLCRALRSEFERWLIEDGAIDSGWPFEDGPVRDQFDARAAAWELWRISYIQKIGGVVSGPKRGRPPDDSKNAELVERVISLGAERSDWLKALESELNDGSSYETLKKKVDRLRRAGWLAPQGGLRTSPRPGPRLLDHRRRTSAPNTSAPGPGRTDTRRNERQ